MIQNIYIGSFTVKRSEVVQVTEKVKTTGYKKRKSYDSKHKPTERILSTVQRSIDSDILRQKYSDKKALRASKRKNSSSPNKLGYWSKPA